VGVAQILDEFKTSSRDYVDVLRLLLEKTDSTMRTFTDVLVKSGVETTTQTDWLREVLPAIEANAQTLVTAAERISRAIEDLRARRLNPERETID
jgi:intergrase/recombinase